ncbi:MAG: hypothetical protein ACK44P_09930 [Bacteroidota bacterium]|jgi:hypothetical protein|nr:hypothetical protein [Sphingobacteriales bacterium]
MRQILLIATILWTTNSFGQTLEEGIYKGQKMPFTICYLTYTDSTIEVEYFFQKGGQIFGHIPAKKLIGNGKLCNQTSVQIARRQY